jgi:hypothetical protein
MASESPKLEQTLRNIQIFHGVFMATMVLYGNVLRLLVRTPAIVEPVFFWSIAGMALGCYCASLLVRARMVAPAIERLRTTPDDVAALARWRSGTILSDALLECVALFGFALYAIGATVPQVALFFVVPFVTMLFLFPRRP